MRRSRAGIPGGRATLLMVPLALISSILLACSGAGGDPATRVPTTTPAADRLPAQTPTLTATRAPAPTPTPRFAEIPPTDWDGDVVHLEELPPEALETLVLIADDGPFPYDQDGSTFQNREGILPDRPTGFYREYTVETPGSSDRGARRLVVGDDDAAYYTDDHYDSFRFVAP